MSGDDAIDHQAEGHGRANGEDTLAPVLAAPDRDELLAWLRDCPLVHREGNHVMVHAGLLPAWRAALVTPAVQLKVQ